MLISISINTWNTHKLREIAISNPVLLIRSFSEADWYDNDNDEANGSSFWMFSFFVSESNEDLAISMIDNDIISHDDAASLIMHTRRIRIFNRLRPHIHPTVHNIKEWIATYPKHRQFLMSSLNTSNREEA